jgi:hypothetical protein
MITLGVCPFVEDGASLVTGSYHPRRLLFARALKRFEIALQGTS